MALLRSTAAMSQSSRRSRCWFLPRRKRNPLQRRLPLRLLPRRLKSPLQRLLPQRQRSLLQSPQRSPLPQLPRLRQSPPLRQMSSPRSRQKLRQLLQRQRLLQNLPRQRKTRSNKNRMFKPAEDMLWRVFALRKIFRQNITNDYKCRFAIAFFAVMV